MQCKVAKFNEKNQTGQVFNLTSMSSKDYLTVMSFAVVLAK